MSNLDMIALTCGTVVTEDPFCVEKEKILNEIKNTLAYDNNSPIPGETINQRLDESLNDINKENAMNSLITQAATIKAKNESSKVITAELRQTLRKLFIDAMLYQLGELYYQQYHYIMDGKTKRKVRKRIERDYDKGKYNKSGIYYELPKVKQLVRKTKANTSNNSEPVNMLDFLKF